MWFMWSASNFWTIVVSWFLQLHVHTCIVRFSSGRVILLWESSEDCQKHQDTLRENFNFKTWWNLHFLNRKLHNIHSISSHLVKTIKCKTQERNLSKVLTLTHPMHYIRSQIFWLCARTRCFSICVPSFVAVVWCKWALWVIAHFERCELSRLEHGTCTKLYPVTVTFRKLTSGKFLSYILLFKCDVPSELKCSVGNRTWKVVGSKDTCPHKKGKLSGITVGCLIWPSVHHSYKWTGQLSIHSIPTDCISIEIK